MSSPSSPAPAPRSATARSSSGRDGQKTPLSNACPGPAGIVAPATAPVLSRRIVVNSWSVSPYRTMRRGSTWTSSVRRSPPHTFTSTTPETARSGGPDTNGTGTAADTGTTGDESCADLREGALITFDVAGQSLTVWITNTTFIAEAERLLDEGTSRIPRFDEVIAAQGCDPQYAWTVDPEAVEFVDVTRELCAGTPAYVDNNLDAWIDELGDYCPWSAQVIEVERLE